MLPPLQCSPLSDRSEGLAKTYRLAHKSTRMWYVTGDSVGGAVEVAYVGVSTSMARSLSRYAGIRRSSETTSGRPAISSVKCLSACFKTSFFLHKRERVHKIVHIMVCTSDLLSFSSSWRSSRSGKFLLTCVTPPSIVTFISIGLLDCEMPSLKLGTFYFSFSLWQCLLSYSMSLSKIYSLI